MTKEIGAPPPRSIEVRFGSSRVRAVDVALHATASVDAIPAAHPEVDWDQLHAVEKGRHSPLAARPKQAAPARPGPLLVNAASPVSGGRGVLAVYLAGRDSRGGTFRFLVRTDHGHHVVMADHLTDPGWEADPAVCQALPAYLRDALARHRGRDAAMTPTA